MKTPLIWEKLVIDGRRMVTTVEVHRLAVQLGKDPERSLRYLQEHEFLCRVLRGIFYVRGHEERGKGFTRSSIYEMVSEALRMKGVRNWYFGLETALKLNNMTHEYYTVDFVITDSYRTTKVIEIAGVRFQFLKWSKRHFGYGIVRKKLLRCSDMEKTLIDMAYKRYLDTKDAGYLSELIHEHGSGIDAGRLAKYLEEYPVGFRRMARRVA
jgi:predicted transcriptional regulator of viral defense system